MGYDRGGPASAVGDRAAQVRWPDRCAILANGRYTVQPFQLLQRGACAHPPGEKLGLTLGDRALDTGGRLDGAAAEILVFQAGRIEPGTEQYRAGQCIRQRPVGVEGRAASGNRGGRVHTGILPGWPGAG
ncbi:hypothetical protein D3C81_1653290 [compost metagenome]